VSRDGLPKCPNRRASQATQVNQDGVRGNQLQGEFRLANTAEKKR